MSKQEWMLRQYRAIFHLLAGSLSMLFSAVRMILISAGVRPSRNRGTSSCGSSQYEPAPPRTLLLPTIWSYCAATV